jgi:hypothetical protein
MVDSCSALLPRTPVAETCLVRRQCAATPLSHHHVVAAPWVQSESSKRVALERRGASAAADEVARIQRVHAGGLAPLAPVTFCARVRPRLVSKVLQLAQVPGTGRRPQARRFAAQVSWCPRVGRDGGTDGV